MKSSLKSNQFHQVLKKKGRAKNIQEETEIENWDTTGLIGGSLLNSGIRYSHCLRRNKQPLLLNAGNASISCLITLPMASDRWTQN